MNDAVEMTTNQFQQNISIKLADDYLSTLLTGNVTKFPVDITKIFNSLIFFLLTVKGRSGCANFLRRFEV